MRCAKIQKKLKWAWDKIWLWKVREKISEITCKWMNKDVFVLKMLVSSWQHGCIYVCYKLNLKNTCIVIHFCQFTYPSELNWIFSWHASVCGYKTVSIVSCLLVAKTYILTKKPKNNFYFFLKLSKSIHYTKKEKSEFFLVNENFGNVKICCRLYVNNLTWSTDIWSVDIYDFYRSGK